MLTLALGLGAVCAQEKKEVKKRATVTFATDLDCENCAKKVLDVIPFKKGVKDVVVDVPTKAVTVTYDPRKTTEANLVEALAKIDVHVQKDCKGADCGKKDAECKDAECKGHDHSHAGHKH
ncbi:MAG: cation transporter [Tidjanibacter sp.]|nr:cation transporter [Tidjanibacter sp.]MBR3852996.1 cation transporter [Tidjanibacter sp.]